MDWGVLVKSKSKEEMAVLQKLYLQNEKLVYRVYQKKFATCHKYKEDLIQCGKLGLWKACLTSNKDERQFSTWAYVIIKNEMWHFLYKIVKHDIYNAGETWESGGEEVNIFDVVADEDIEQDIESKDYAKWLLSLMKSKKIWEAVANGQSLGKIADESNIKRTTLWHRLTIEKNMAKTKLGIYNKDKGAS